MNCIYCETPLPEKGFFCPNCFKQTKCKHCNEALLVEAKICVFCGEDILQKASSSNLNTIEFSETETGRNFKASFSDTVGQSISDSFGMILSNKIDSRKNLSDGLPFPRANPEQNNTIDIDSEIVNDSPIVKNPELADTPSLTEVKLRDLAKSETDWLLVYTYYASKGGTKEFSREEIIQLYKDSDRKTNNRLKGLSQIIKNVSKALYIKSTNDTNFILLEKGKARVLEIFNDNSNSRSSKKASIKTAAAGKQKDVEPKEVQSKGKKTKASSSIGFIDLKFTLAEQKSLTDFFTTKKPKSQNEKVIIAMKWYIDHKKTDEVSLEELNYLLSIAAETPSALPQVLGNMIGPNYRWITKGSKGKYQLSSIGESYIINKLPKDNK